MRSGEFIVTKGDFEILHVGDRILFLTDSNNEIFRYRFRTSKTMAGISHIFFSERIFYLSAELQNKLLSLVPNISSQGSYFNNSQWTGQQKFLITYQWLSGQKLFGRYLAEGKKLRILDSVIIDKYSQSYSEDDDKDYFVACRNFPVGKYIKVSLTIYQNCNINSHAFVFENPEGKCLGFFPATIFELAPELDSILERYE